MQSAPRRADVAITLPRRARPRHPSGGLRTRASGRVGNALMVSMERGAHSRPEPRSTGASPEDTGDRGLGPQRSSVFLARGTLTQTFEVPSRSPPHRLGQSQRARRRECLGRETAVDRSEGPSAITSFCRQEREPPTSCPPGHIQDARAGRKGLCFSAGVAVDAPPHSPHEVRIPSFTGRPFLSHMSGWMDSCRTAGFQDPTDPHGLKRTRLLAEKRGRVAGSRPPNSETRRAPMGNRKSPVLVGCHRWFVVAVSLPCRTPQCGSAGTPDLSMERGMMAPSGQGDSFRAG